MAANDLSRTYLKCSVQECVRRDWPQTMRRLTVATHYALPLALLAAVAVMLGLGTWPHGYYRAIRFVVCAIAILVGAAAYEQQKLG